MGCPLQIALLPVIKQAACKPTVTVALHVLTHPRIFVILTEYVPAALTVMQLLVEPLLHKYVEPATKGTHNCVLCPVQMDKLPVIKHGTSKATVTIALQVVVTPPAVVIVTE